jgi:hypothetical protein
MTYMQSGGAPNALQTTRLLGEFTKLVEMNGAIAVENAVGICRCVGCWLDKRQNRSVLTREKS